MNTNQLFAELDRFFETKFEPGQIRPWRGDSILPDPDFPSLPFCLPLLSHLFRICPRSRARIRCFQRGAGWRSDVFCDVGLWTRRLRPGPVKRLLRRARIRSLEIIPDKIRDPTSGERLMDRNLILAIVLSVVIIVGFQFLFQTFSPPPPKKPPATRKARSSQCLSPRPGKRPIEQERPAVKRGSPAARPEPRVPTPTARDRRSSRLRKCRSRWTAQV